MKTYYHVMGFIIIAIGVLAFLRNKDKDTFRFCMVFGMLCNIYAAVTDL